MKMFLIAFSYYNKGCSLKLIYVANYDLNHESDKQIVLNQIGT